MQTYLVGGAVRDRLLGYPFKEKDWVVVGSSPDEMIRQGFKPVGKDFPVFIRPGTGEEYALARTERKSAPGYTGFIFHCDPSITIEEDLRRRDLTINAIAEDSSGKLVDPYGGINDIEQRVLRHVSAAFAEDPVRILRVARFAARYHHLGFSIAPETLALMKDIVGSGETDHLVQERVWQETRKALAEKNPAVFFTVLNECGALQKIFPEIHALFGVPQTAAHHPEIDSGKHAIMALEQAALLSPEPRVRFATLIHDLGKATTPIDEWPQHIAHEQRSLPLVKNLCTRLTVPNDYRDLALITAKFHTHCHRAMEMKATTIYKMFCEIDVFRRPERLAEFLLCCEADAKGRTGLEQREYPQRQYIQTAFDACTGIANDKLMAEGYTGKALGEAIKHARINAIMQITGK